ncbi:hypothetical protein QBC34DRAFT_402936 [Podospora aff. communis PSN243]|uniref:Uncharacterized protein n=1 Tax=Podospora aff. communis PSN243 TaxID=3040156 RepID=A0AAV9GRN7_9PEZI|nr:hypothetical protein QBC34DRAFT_402936 [Podospora aff. communis PSN243]
MIRIWGWLLAAAFTFFSIAGNFVFLLGCSSPATVKLALNRVEVDTLALSLLRLAYNDTRNASQLLHPGLPAYWYWGTSGICSVTDSQHPIHCRPDFPATDDLWTIVWKSAGDLNIDQVQENGMRLSDAWNDALMALPSSTIRDNEYKAIRKTEASIGLCIVAVIFDFLIPPFALWKLKKSQIAKGKGKGRTSKSVYLASLFSSLLAIAAGVLAISAMKDGVRSIVDTDGFEAGQVRGLSGDGPGMFVRGTGLRLAEAATGVGPGIWLFLTAAGVRCLHSVSGLVIGLCRRS